MPALDIRSSDEAKSIVRTLGAGHDLLIGHVCWHRGQRTLFGHSHILGMRPIIGVIVSKYPIANRKRRDIPANCLNFTGKLVSEDPVSWSEEAEEDSPEDPESRR